jgi:hypothetical protein
MEMIMLHSDHWLGRPEAAGRLAVRNASASDELLIKALQPLSLLQIGMQQQLLGRRSGIATREAMALDEVLRLIDEEDFNAVVLGPDLADVWPTAAYERVAEVAGPIPIMVYTDSVEAMAMVKRRQERSEDVIVASDAMPRLLEHLLLAAILRNRALAESPGARIA